MRRFLAYLLLGLGALVAAVVALGVYSADGPHAYAAVTLEEAAEARAYLEAGQTPLPPNSARGWFEVGDDVRLETLRYDHPDAKATIVIVPDFTAPLDLYADTIIAFQEAGYSVAALSTRGQGRSTRLTENPEKGYVEDYRILAADLTRFIAPLDGPVFVYGNSMGGHIAMLMAGIAQPDVAGYALLVPMAKILTGEIPYGAAWALTGASVALGFGENYGVGRGDWSYQSRDIAQPTRCSADPTRAHVRHMLFALEPELRVEDVTNRWVWETMHSTAEVGSPDFLSYVDRPVLTITAGRDLIVDSAKAEANCAAMPNCILKRFDAARHCIMHEGRAQQDAVLGEVIAFFDALVEPQ